MSSQIEKRISEWRDRISEASVKWGAPEICAVTKTIEPERINEVLNCGIHTIGENRVQELLGKLDGLNKGFEIHMIGHLQSNKAKSIIGVTSTIQSLDSLPLAEEISRRSVAAGLVTKVLVQINIGREKQKSGIPEELLHTFLNEVSGLPGIHIGGLMSIMPFVQDPEDIRTLFRRMRTLFDRFREEPVENVDMHVLSMGMSDDCIVAAQEGATMVRLGRAIFGERL